jgi:hypothetical protein
MIGRVGRVPALPVRFPRTPLNDSSLLEETPREPQTTQRRIHPHRASDRRRHDRAPRNAGDSELHHLPGPGPSRRAYANLAGIARAERGYFAENGTYYEALTHPNPGGGGTNLGAQTHGWDGAAKTEFKGLGWEPEGRVRYAYDINTGATACTGDCDDTCFTASSYGDVDNDDQVSAVMYVSPGSDEFGNFVECPAHLFGLGTPVKLNSNEKIYNEVAVNRATDEY